MVGTYRCDMGKTKKSANKSSKYVTADGHSYLTKRILVSKARTAGRKAASTAMNVMGFVVTIEEGNVVKKYSDGSIEILGEIGNQNLKIAFD